METDYLMTSAAEAKLDRVLDRLANIDADIAQFRKGTYERDMKALNKAKETKALLVTKLGGLADKLVQIENQVSDDATKALVKSARDEILDALTADETVDREDNPAPQE